MKELRNISITVLALGTAYGLGVLTSAVYGVKLWSEVMKETPRRSPRYVSYGYRETETQR